MNRKGKLLLTIAMAVTVLSAFLGACKKDHFVPTTGLCPLVVSTDPDNSATSVALDKVITITFNEVMNPATITTANITLQGATPIAGTIAYSGNTAFFTPSSPLANNTTYTGRVSTAVRDANGLALQTDYVWTFSTGATLSPVVMITNPINNAIDVPLNKTITATFNMGMDPLTINGNTFFLKKGSSNVGGVVTMNGATASFLPSTALSPNTVYIATMTTGAKTITGTSIANNYIWTFTTGTLNAPTVISTDPNPSSTGVVLNKIIAATFSEVMNPLSINTTSFTLMEGSTVIPGIVSYSGTSAYFKPIASLLPNTIYTATINTGAKSMAGMSLDNNYVWVFTTDASIAPIVILTTPISNAMNVPLTIEPKATFSMPMDPSTINSGTFTLKIGTTPVSGNVSHSGTVATFTPTANLLSGTVYTATLTTGAKSLTGIPLSNNYTWNFTTNASAGPNAVNLGSVAAFGIIAGVGVTNQAGQSEIHDMNVGIYPGVRSSIFGFPPALVIGGAIYASDDITPPGVPAMLLQAKTDLTNAYLFAESASTPAPITVAGDQGGLTLTPGIYKSTSTLLIQSGNLTLDAQGDVNAVWIFQIAGGFTTVGGAGGSVILVGGAQAKNVFWQTGSSAVIGDYTSFQGTILALTSITMNSHATVVGRMLARNGAVVMTSTNLIIKP